MAASLMAQQDCENCHILSEEIVKLKKIIKQQQNVIKSAKKGPVIYIGNINLRWHELESWPYEGDYDPYYWPKYKWFPEYENHIICESNKTE